MSGKYYCCHHDDEEGDGDDVKEEEDKDADEDGDFICTKCSVNCLFPLPLFFLY